MMSESLHHSMLYGGLGISRIGLGPGRICAQSLYWGTAWKSVTIYLSLINKDPCAHAEYMLALNVGTT